MERLIFLTAIEEEFAPLRSRLGKATVRNEVACDFFALGAGIINSTINLEKKVSGFAGKPRIFFLGTAGILGRPFVPGEVYQASCLRWTSIGLALQKGFLPQKLYPDIEARGFPDGPPKMLVVSTPEITADDDIALRLGQQHGACLENLEAYGVAAVLKSFGLSVSVF